MNYTPILIATLLSITSLPAEQVPVPTPTATALVDFQQVEKLAAPAVVRVKVNGSFKAASPYGQEFDTEPFESDVFGQFFKFYKRNAEIPQTDEGSGFLVSVSGYILTNSHIVKNRSEIKVTLTNGKEYSAVIVGQDPSTDVALLKIDETNLPYLKLANSSELEVGQWVAALGIPNAQVSLTAGIVNATGRGNLDIVRIEDFIQTDAAINKGNSGGPLLNLKGEVVGINTAIDTGVSNGNMGVGFAIPSNIAKNVMEQLIETGAMLRDEKSIKKGTLH